MAKRLQVQGPRLRSEQTKVIAPMVDTYYREAPLDPTQLKAVKLAEFVSDVVDKGSSLAKDVKDKKENDAVLKLADYSWTIGDKKTFDEVADELGIIKTDKVARAYHTMRGERQGQVIANEIQEFLGKNKSRYLDSADSELMQTELTAKMNELLEAASVGEEGSFGFGKALSEKVQGRFNQVTQTFLSEFTAAKEEEVKVAASVSISNALETGYLSQVIAASDHLGAMSDLSRSERKAAIESATIAKIGLEPQNARKYADMVYQIPTVGGSTLGDIPEFRAKIETAIKQAYRAEEADAVSAIQRQNRKQKEEEDRLMSEYTADKFGGDFKEIPDSEYNEDIWGSREAFNKFRRLRAADNDAYIMSQVDTYENFMRIYNEIRLAGDRSDAKEKVLELQASARNLRERQMINTAANGMMNDGTVSMYEEPSFLTMQRKLQEKFKYDGFQTYQNIKQIDKQEYEKQLVILKEEYFRLVMSGISREPDADGNSPLDLKLEEFFEPVIKGPLPSDAQITQEPRKKETEGDGDNTGTTQTLISGQGYSFTVTNPNNQQITVTETKE